MPESKSNPNIIKQSTSQNQKAKTLENSAILHCITFQHNLDGESGETPSLIVTSTRS